MASTPAFNMEAFDLQFEALYGLHIARGAYAEDVIFSIETENPRRSYRVPLHDEEAVRALVWRIAKDATTGIHYRVCPLRNRQYEWKEAGKAADATAFPALVMDFDTADGYHEPFPKGSPFEGFRLPTKAEIHDLIEDIMPDSFRVDTGGGYQSVFALHEPMDAQDPAMKALRQRIQENWAAAARERGFGLDMSVGVKVTQTQRLAGSVNWKRNDPRPVTVVKEWDPACYTVEDLMAQFPAPPPKATRPRPRRGLPAGRDTVKLSKATEAFAAGVPVTFLMESVWGMEERVPEDPQSGNYGRWAFPREDGSFGTDTHAAVTTNDRGIQIAFAHGNRLQSAWGRTAETPVNSFDLLLQATGSPYLATVLADTYQEPCDELADAIHNLRATASADY